ncbi:hypothetical protein V8687_23540 (plasmid) [Shewanella baltica]|uniref:hypothetical protein n=1 Tax=Shewanella baltica TaxID=62322 RepID=UPI0030D4F0C4
MIKILVGGVGIILISQAVLNFTGLEANLDASYKASTVIVETIEAGKTVSVSFDKSFWGDTTTLTTDKGVFIVNGLVSMMTGEPLVIKKQQNGKSFLCDEKTEVCHLLN